jgi:hypothetical protein
MAVATARFTDPASCRGLILSRSVVRARRRDKGDWHGGTSNALARGAFYLLGLEVRKGELDKFLKDPVSATGTTSRDCRVGMVFSTQDAKSNHTDHEENQQPVEEFVELHIHHSPPNALASFLMFKA